MKPLKSRRETYSGRKGMICAVLLAATAENLACAMRIPVGDEGKKAASVLGVPDGYMIPCYIGIGYPKENEHTVEQVERTVESTLHFGKW